MKTIKDIQKLLDESIDYLQSNAEQLKASQQKRIESKIAFYKMCLRYLETKPLPEFIKSEIDSINNKLVLIADNYKHWTPSTKHSDKTDLHKCYEAEMDVPKYKAQLKTLNFLNN